MPPKNSKTSLMDNARRVRSKQTTNCISTLLSLPRIIDGITEDKTKIQEKA
jgi:hypothetical protein